MVLANNIQKLIEEGNRLMFDINISPKSWVNPNRVKFNNWIDETFKYDAISFNNSSIKTRKMQNKDEQQDACATKADSVELFSHQKFIKDYIQYDSPYRGLFVFHGLGTGKTCSAVASAEVLLKNMNVVVLLPASLKPNFIDEIKKCGNMFYKLKQNWVFLPRAKFIDDVDFVAKSLSLDKKFIAKKEGVWVPTNDKSHNFSSLSIDQQNNVIEQIDNMIKNRFTFISYNGLTKKAVAEMTEGGKNPFDNQCVIIDEVHNFISKIVNGRQIGQALYKLLMNAKNCKLICLSGTPIINYPNEIAYLVNLLCGYRKTYTLKLVKTAPFIVEDVKKILESSSYVDYYAIDENTKSIFIILAPEGFQILNNTTGLLARDPKNLSHSDVLQQIASRFPQSKRTVTEQKALPEDQEEFNRYFINFGTNKISNPKLFMKRIIGTVSFYSTYSPALYPSVSKHEVALPMTDYQFPIYEEARAKEHKKESLSKNKNDGDNPFASTGQVYRFYSRAICNFVFPENIKRPFPSKLSLAKGELETIDEDDVDKSASVSASATKKVERDEYLTELNKALDALSEDMYQQQSYLNANNISKYSPKFKYILDKVQDLHGNALVYSQFRKVEGLGVLGLVLQANGFAEFKLKKLSTGEWDIDIDKEDMKKPKFAMFTGNNDESKIILKIFNSDFETLPDNIKRKLPLLKSLNEDTNLHGSLIKVIMITQSGAEGISLKNVRQVHIIEPYWNHVRMDQVVGRAVRTCSHVALPPKERHVEVFTYYTTLSPQHLDKSFTLRTKDKGLTTDEYIYNIAKRKASIIESILALMKKAAVDCGINAKKHKNVECFTFPTNMNTNDLVFNHNITDDPLDYQYETDIVKVDWEGKVIKTKLGNFLVNTTNNNVYDYDLYIDSGKLLKVGELKEVNGKMAITKPQPSLKTVKYVAKRNKK
jgi:superfamily II DNA or RNA helicase